MERKLDAGGRPPMCEWACFPVGRFTLMKDWNYLYSVLVRMVLPSAASYLLKVLTGVVGSGDAFQAMRFRPG